MRLIDADKIDFNEVFVGASKFAEDTRQAGKMLIDAQPTAYDVDKVVERIQKIPFRLASMKARIIHIVKGGGTDGVHIRN